MGGKEHNTLCGLDYRRSHVPYSPSHYTSCSRWAPVPWYKRTRQTNRTLDSARGFLVLGDLTRRWSLVVPFSVSLGGPDSRTGSCWSTTRGTRVRNLTPSLLDLISEVLANENKCADISNTSAGSVKMCRPGRQRGDEGGVVWNIHQLGGERADISPRRSRNTFTSTPRLLFSSYKACVKKSTCCLIFLHHMIPHTGNIENVQHIKKKKLRRRWSNQKKAAQPADVFSRLQRLDALGRWFMQKKGPRGPPAIKYRSALSAWAQIKSTCTK